MCLIPKFACEVLVTPSCNPWVINLPSPQVGIPGQSGLSVEQRKRLTIANEMVASPSVMFMVSELPEVGREG